MITPWEVSDLPEEWLAGAQALTGQIDEARKVNAVIEQKLAAWRSSHKYYNKRM